MSTLPITPVSLSKRRVPAYCRHKQGRGTPARAFVTLNGERRYLGDYGSAESRQEFDRIIAEWIGNGRRRHVSEQDITIVELIAAFWNHARSYYRKVDGTPTSTLHRFAMAFRRLKELYGRALATSFAPAAIKAVRQKMVEAGWTRAVVNECVGQIRLLFKWGVENGMVRADILQSLKAVAPLKRGRCEAPEGRKVRPVPMAYGNAVKPHVSQQVWAMIQLQLLTGARAGELVIMRAIDLDTSGNVWTFKPTDHKTAHHNRERIVYVGPRAQEVIRPFLAARSVSAFLFSPRETEADRRAAMHAQRKTKLSCGNRPGSNRVRKPRREPGERYDTASYRRAIERACKLAFPVPEHLLPAEGEDRKDSAARPAEEQKAEIRKWHRDHR